MILFRHIRQSILRPDHWLYGAWIDFVARYRRMFFGLVWAVIPPIVYIWGIGGFLRILQPGIDKELFLAHVAISFATFRFVSTILTNSTSLFQQYRVYIFDGCQRLTDFVFRDMANSVLHLVAALPAVLVALLAWPDAHWSGLPAAMLGLAVVVLNMFMLSIIVAFVGAKFRDLHEVMGSVVMFLFLVTPIVWLGDQAPAGSIQERLMHVNPIYHFIELVRAPLFGEAVKTSTWIYVGATAALSFPISILCYRSFSKRLAVWL
jgi:ABC-2 type transport system permease protein